MNVRALQRALTQKLGATEDRRSSHIFYFVDIAGKGRRAAKLSHSARGQVPHYVINDTAKRLRLDSSEVHQLVDCKLSGDAAIDLWIQRST